MKKSMKLWQKILIGLLAAAVLFCVYFFGIWLFSDRIVRVTYNGLENMFFVHDEYLAVAGPFHVRVPQALAQTSVKSEISTIGDTDKEVGRNFHVSVCWNENGRPRFEKTTQVFHSYSAKYGIEVRNPGPEKVELTRDEEKRILEIAEHFHNFNEPYVRGEDNWTAYNGVHTTIIFFDVFFQGDKTFFCINRGGKKDTLYSYDNGHFLRIYSVPEKGDFDLVIWKGMKES